MKKNTLEYISASLLAILIALMLQYIAYGIMFYKELELASFTALQIVIETVYILFALITALLIVIDKQSSLASKGVSLGTTELQKELRTQRMWLEMLYNHISSNATYEDLKKSLIYEDLIENLNNVKE